MDMPYSRHALFVRRKAQELTEKYQCDAAPIWLLALYMARMTAASQMFQEAVPYEALRQVLLEKWGMTEAGPGSYGVRWWGRDSAGIQVARAPSQPVLNRAAEMANERAAAVVTPVHLALALLEDREILEILRASTAPESVARLKAQLGQMVVSEELLEFPDAEVLPETAEQADSDRAGSGVHNTERQQSGAVSLSAITGGAKSPRPWQPRALSSDSVLRKYARDVTQLAADGKIDPVIGRQREIQWTIDVLNKRKKKNPLLVGPPGVGKTSIVEGVARRIVDGDVPDKLLDKRVFAVDMADLLRKTEYRGSFEDKLKEVLEEIMAHGHIIFFDETHTVLGAGLTRGSNLDAGNALKTALAGTKLSAIGCTTLDEYRKLVENKDAALARRFVMIPVGAPSVEESIAILQRVKCQYEDHHQVDYDDAALEAAVRLSHRYVRKRNLPDKAIDAIDEAASMMVARTANSGDSAARPRVTVDEIAAVITRWTRIDVSKRVKEDERVLLLSLEKIIGKRIVSQRPAIKAVSAAVRRARADLKRPDKPVGTYIFAGPTGVGKSETAKQLALALGLDFVRFEMQLYTEKTAVARLIGADPGYVGFDNGGLLTNAIDEHPHSVLLLDEIEKAHPDLFNALLGVMEYGEMTDSQGRVVDFRNVIIIMSTNCGATELRRFIAGFQGGKPKCVSTGGKVHPTVQQSINVLFSPEFRNRVDDTIMFDDLTPDEILRVVDVQLEHTVNPLLANREMRVELSQSARRLFGRLGFSEEYGARPLERLINTMLLTPLADQILLGRHVKAGDTLHIGTDERETELVYPWPPMPEELLEAGV